MMEDMSKTETSTNKWVVRPDKDLEDLIPDFMQNRRKDLADITQAIGRHDFEFVRRLAHTLKGICRPYGFDHLETLSKQLEVAGQVENEDEVRRIAEEIRSYLENVRIVYDS